MNQITNVPGNTQPLISVCIPAYNTTDLLERLLLSIVTQDCDDFEILVCDDCSPHTAEIESIVKRFQKEHSRVPIYYKKNRKNLGYDGNLRELFRSAHGEYCLLMGDDDLMCEGVLKQYIQALRRYPETGVVLRSYVSIERESEKNIQEFKYFATDRVFESGKDTAITFFRRSVVISGLTIHRKSAIRFETTEYDGTLLYQLHLVGNILFQRDGLYIAEPIAKYRVGGVHNFGSSEAEKALFRPKVITPEHSLNFMKGMLRIAKGIEQHRGIQVYHAILEDLGNYSYGFLAIQAKSLKGFLWYSLQLAKLGFGRYRMFYFYVSLLLCFHPSVINFVFGKIKKIRGQTPLFGHVSSGKALEHDSPRSFKRIQSQ